MSFGLNRNFERAVTLHQAGRLSEAEGIYRNILAVEPKHVNSLHLLGVIAIQAGRNDIAVDLIGQAIASNKRNAEFHKNMGVALRALGRLDEAIKHFRRALKLKPDYADAYNNLGLVSSDQGQFVEAERRYPVGSSARTAARGRESPSTGVASQPRRRAVPTRRADIALPRRRLIRRTSRASHRQGKGCPC